MSPFGWVKFGLEAGKALIDLWRVGRSAAEESDDSEGTNPEKVLNQASGASATSEAKLVGKKRR